RAAIKAWGLALCAKDPKWNSDTVSAIMTPAGIDGAQIISNAFKKYNLALGAGLGQMAGKLFRIGHLGDLNELMLLGAIAGAEMFSKAAEGPADYVFLDLEDAVAPNDKEQARINTIQALGSIDWRARGKTISVRINGIDTHYMYRDVVDVIEQSGQVVDTVLI